MRSTRTIRLSDAERSLIEVAAEREGASRSSFIRRAAIRRASEVIDRNTGSESAADGAGKRPSTVE